MGNERLGAYGFRLVLPRHEKELPNLSPVPEDALDVAFEWRHASVLVERNELDSEAVLAGEKGADSLEVRRNPPSITLGFAEQTTPEALVHPLLTGPMSILARWRGDLTLHAGAFFADDRAWAVMGEREAGKSTALAQLAARGCPLLADDLLVLDEGIVRAGPSCIDLRPDVAARAEGALALGEIGGRPRYRLPTSHGPARAELAGFFLMSWGHDPAVSIEQVPASEALKIVYEQEYIGLMGPADPGKVLDLLGVPMWRVRRPADWSFTEETAEKMLEITGESAT